jgi:hypothetical protein
LGSLRTSASAAARGLPLTIGTSHAVQSKARLTTTPGASHASNAINHHDKTGTPLRC